MGWIRPEDRMPPEGLQVLLEVSGLTTAPYSLVWDHDFCLAAGSFLKGKKVYGI